MALSDGVTLHADAVLIGIGIHAGIDIAQSAGIAVAQKLMGGSVEFVASAWFWSDQYDYQLQVSGPAAGMTTVVREQEDGDVLVFTPTHKTSWSVPVAGA